MAGGAIILPSKRTGRKVTLKEKLPTGPILIPFILVTSLFFLWGFAYGLLDVLNKHFQNTLGITKLQSTGLQVAYFGLGYFAFASVAGEVLRRKGYRFTILMGLSFYSTGAILFWPCAHFSTGNNHGAVFAGFVICTGIIACGLSSLETSANSYITTLPSPDPASCSAFRLQLSQSFNGVASFAGPFIASKYFFSGAAANDLTNVQWVYLAVSIMGVIVAAIFAVTKLPETSEAELQAQLDAGASIDREDDAQVVAHKPFYKFPRPFFGFVAQFLYVGAQVTIGAFFINYGAEAVGWADAKSSNFLSYSLIMFTVGRFAGVVVLSYLPAELVVGIWSAICFVLVFFVALLGGIGGMSCMMLVYFFESPLFPCLFVISTINLGHHTRRASSLLVSAVGGGAVFPPIQGAIADIHGTRISMAVTIPCFAYISAYGFFLWWHHGHKLSLNEPKMTLEPALEASGMMNAGHLGESKESKEDVKTDEISVSEKM